MHIEWWNINTLRQHDIKIAKKSDHTASQWSESQNKIHHSQTNNNTAAATLANWHLFLRKQFYII